MIAALLLLLEARATRSQIATQVTRRTVRTVELLLQLVTLCLGVTQAVTRIVDFHAELFNALRLAGSLLVQCGDVPLTLQHTGLFIGVACHAQPVFADPDPFAGDYGFMRSQPGAHGQRLDQRLRRVDAVQQTLH